jgi:hypothetical protein
MPEATQETSQRAHWAGLPRQRSESLRPLVDGVVGPLGVQEILGAFLGLGVPRVGNE